MTPSTRAEGGFFISGPDYSVVRLSLVALSDSQEGDFERLELVGRLLRRSRSDEARRWADYSLMRGRERLVADSADKRYVNVVWGQSIAGTLPLWRRS